MIEINDVKKRTLFIAIVFYLFCGCCVKNTSKSDLYKKIIVKENSVTKEIMLNRMKILNNSFFIEKALFANKLINIPSQDYIGIIFTLDCNNNIKFDDKTYEIKNIDMINEKNLYYDYSFSSKDVRGYNGLLRVVLNINEEDKFKEIHILIDDENQQIFCYIYEDEFNNGFYQSEIINF